MVNLNTIVRRSLPILTAVCLMAGIPGCSQPVSHSTGPAAMNPAFSRMGALAGIPPESDGPPVAVVPNLTPFIDAATVAAANTEANALKTAARVFLVDQPSSRTITSDDLGSQFAGGPPKARYSYDGSAARIAGVDAVPGGWRGIVFNLSTQSWQEGTADGDRNGDQDIP